MELLSCINCCHNPLRAGVIGVDAGFCTQHGVVLRAPATTTCGRLLRKDLLAESAARVRERHRARYASSGVRDLHTRAPAGNATEPSNGQGTGDAVMSEAMAFARYERGTKIASLAALRRISGARADVALTSLGRAWAHTCHARSKRWTAGLHLLWWTLNRLTNDPAPHFEELRDTSGLDVARALSMATWTVVALRLFLVSDVASFAGSQDDVGELATLADDALGATEPSNGAALLAWLAAKARRRVDRALPEERYVALARRLRG